MPDPPTLSIVIPVYDVAPYVRDCLASVAAQTLTDLEVICIDDGSTDGSGEILDEVAASDPRFRVVHQANAGPGAARNRGVQHTRGEYVAFVDADDLVHPNAFAPMVRSLERSGSDFATGKVERLTSLGVRPSPTFAPVFARPRTATHVTRDHVLLLDRLAATKVWRRSFWDEHQLGFAEGMLYEDIPLAIPAHFLATSVDVLDSPMYLWRIRGGADRSITQRRLEPGHIRDRVAAVTEVSRFIGDRGYDDEKREYDRLVLTGDLRFYAALLDRADREVVDEFVDRAGGFLAQAHPRALEGERFLERLRWHLVAERDAPGVAEVARFVRLEGADALPTRRRRGHVEAVPPFVGRLPRQLRRIDDEVDVETAVTGFRLDGDAVTIEGWAHLRHVPTPDVGSHDLEVVLVHETSGERLALAVEAVTSPEATAASRPDLHDQTGAGFRATLPTAELTGRWESKVDRWRAEVTVTAGRLTRTGPLRRPAPGATRRPGFADVGDLRVSGRAEGDDVGVTVAARPVTLVACVPTADGLELTVGSRRDLATLRLRRAHADDRTTPLTATGEGRFTASVPVSWFLEDAAPAADRPEVWAVHAVTADDRAARLVVVEGAADQVAVPAGAHELSLDITRYGNVSIGVRPAALWLTGITTLDDAVEITARTSGRVPPAPHLLLERRDRRDRRLVAFEVDGDRRLVARVPADGPPGPLGSRPFPAGTWHLGAVAAPGTADERRLPVQVQRSVVTGLPVGLRDRDGRTVAVDDLAWQRPAVLVDDGLATTERGRFHQQRLWAAVTRARRLDPDTVVVDAATRGDTDAVVSELRHRRPDLRIVRTDPSPGPSPDAAVRRGSRAWVEALATAAAVLTDRDLPDGFAPDAAQRVVRLWPATPVRPVGRSRPELRDAHTYHRDTVVRAARRWTHLVSPSPAATRTLREAYDVTGQVLETGAPRFDVLADPAALQTRVDRLRRDLAEPTGPIVVWTPTWSAEDRHPGGALRSTPEIDPRRLRDAAGADGRLLVRHHPAVGDRAGDDLVGAGIVDVSDHPDPVALLAAADVVVTPPTSMVLDAVAVATPVVVLDPGGAWAATEQVTLDLTHDVPWSVVTDDADLADAVARVRIDAAVPAVPARLRPHLDLVTGSAAAAVASAVLGEPTV